MRNLAEPFSWGTLMKQACPNGVCRSAECLEPKILRFAAQGMEAFMASPEYPSTVMNLGVLNAGSVTCAAVFNLAEKRVEHGSPSGIFAKILNTRRYTLEVIALVAARALDALPAEERMDVAGGELQRAGPPCLLRAHCCACLFVRESTADRDNVARFPFAGVWPG